MTVAQASVDKLLYTPLEAAAALAIGRSTLFVLLARGEIASVRIGSARRIPAAALEAYIERLRNGADTQRRPVHTQAEASPSAASS